MDGYNKLKIELFSVLRGEESFSDPMGESCKDKSLAADVCVGKGKSLAAGVDKSLVTGVGDKSPAAEEEGRTIAFCTDPANTVSLP